MTVLAFALFAAAILGMVVTHVLVLRRMEAKITARRIELDELDAGRQKVLYRQQKAMAHTIAGSDRAVRKMVDQARTLHDDTRQLHERVDRHVARLKKEARDGG